MENAYNRIDSITISHAEEKGAKEEEKKKVRKETRKLWGGCRADPIIIGNRTFFSLKPQFLWLDTDKRTRSKKEDE